LPSHEVPHSAGNTRPHAMNGCKTGIHD
jgi:hypothetical protein